MEQAKELEKKIAEQRDLLIHVDHIMVYHPVIRKIKELIDGGAYWGYNISHRRELIP